MAEEDHPEHLDPEYVAGYDAKTQLDLEDALERLRRHGLGPRTTLVDLGCGTGLLAAAAASEAGRVVGVDPSPAMLEVARRRSDAVEWDQAGFLTYDDAFLPIGKLSGGEKGRLQIARLMLTEANFLVLDEPTNNLDIPSIEVLEAALDEFDGTVVAVSHDRYFLDRLATRIVAIEDGAVREYHGNYSDYLRRSRR